MINKGLFQICKRQVRLLLMLIGALQAFNGTAQYTLKGQVLSEENGAALAGATLSLKQAKTHTNSNAEGLFILNIKHFPDTLMVSYAGFKTQTRILSLENKPSYLKLRLIPHIKSLQEVVISNGYQILPKERATGAFSNISNQLFNQQTSTNILERLEATASGVLADRGTAGAQVKLMVRGLSTLGGPREQLIVLDNFPYEGDINNINPNDVESITILKDAAAASIWGARAGNGVIVITTKKAKANQPLAIEFNSNLTAGEKPDLFYLKEISASDFIDVEQLLYSKGYYQSQINSSTKPLLSPVIELLIKRGMAPDIEKQNIDDQINALRNLDVRNDFSRYLYNESINQQYAFNVRGGSARHSWLFSSGYDQNLSNLDAGYSRLNLRFNNTLNISQKLSLSTNLYYTLSNTKSGKPPYGSISAKANSIYPYARFADGDGNPLPIGKQYREGFLESFAGKGLLDWKYYPLEDYKHSKNSSKRQDALLNMALDYKILDGLKLSLQYQYEKQYDTDKSLQDKDSFFTRDIINSFTQIATDGKLTRNIPMGDILDLSHAEMNSHQLRGQLYLDKAWQNHQLTVLAGTEVRQNISESDLYRTYGYNPENLAFGTIDLTRTYPKLVTGSGDFIPDERSFGKTNARYLSFYGNTAYTYLNRYTVSGSIRRDASNLFGVSTNNKWKPLWSAGLGWNISKESFYHSNILSDLKFRMTYGFSGNTDPARTAVTTLYNMGNSSYTLLPFYGFDQYANPSLKWETVKQVNAAADFNMLNGRLGGSVDLYWKKGTDLYGSIPIDYTTGVGLTVKRNVATIKGKGIDIVLRSLNTSGPVRWETDVNFSYHKDQIEDYYITSLQGSNFMLSGGTRISGLKGNAIYAVYSYKWAGLEAETGLPQGYLNGTISKDYNAITGAATTVKDLNYHGSAIPVYYGSAGNTLSWKQFSVTARVLFKLDYYLKRAGMDYSNLFSSWAGHSDYAKRWQQPGDEKKTAVPALVYPLPGGMNAFYTNAEPLVIKGDHIRLQYVTVNYILNKVSNPKLPLKTINFYLNVNNLGIIWKANKEHIDPDYAGINTLLPPKTFTAGIKAIF
jgi:TonB-linked SusC/RagA family outer membrane protein